MGTFLISEAAVASTIISSLIMSNKATHRQTAHPLPDALHINNKLISRCARISKEILKKREICSFWSVIFVQRHVELEESSR